MSACAMTDKAQILALSRLAGWRIYRSNGLMYYERPGGNVRNHELSAFRLPRFLDDIEVIRKLRLKLRESNLCLSDDNFLPVVKKLSPLLCDISARQYSEAVLRCVGLWREPRRRRDHKNDEHKKKNHTRHRAPTSHGASIR